MDQATLAASSAVPATTVAALMPTERAGPVLVETSRPPVPMSNVETTVIAVAIALVVVFASSIAALVKKR